MADLLTFGIDSEYIDDMEIEHSNQKRFRFFAVVAIRISNRNPKYRSTNMTYHQDFEWIWDKVNDLPKNGTNALIIESYKEVAYRVWLEQCKENKEENDYAYLKGFENGVNSL